MSIAENQVISNQLQKTVVGKTVVKTFANQNPHSFVWFATQLCYAFAAKEIFHKQAELNDEMLTGSVIRDSRVNFGGYITKASKNTLGKPCKRCGEIIVKEAYLGGAVYYCPKCQPFIKN
jgi:hypothetical protein